MDQTELGENHVWDAEQEPQATCICSHYSALLTQLTSPAICNWLLLSCEIFLSFSFVLFLFFGFLFWFYQRRYKRQLEHFGERLKHANIKQTAISTKSCLTFFPQLTGIVSNIILYAHQRSQICASFWLNE